MRLIDANAFIKENQEIIDCEIDHPKYQDTLRELISQAPTVEAYTFEQVQDLVYLNKKLSEERPHGEWKDYTDDGYVECPFCGSATNCDGNIDDLHYCFFCGASMVKEGEAE